MTPIFVGGCIRQLVERLNRDDPVALARKRERGILFGSGLVGGEGLMGVGVALWAFYFDKPKGVGLVWPEPVGELVALALFALMGYVLFRRAK